MSVRLVGLASVSQALGNKGTLHECPFFICSKRVKRYYNMDYQEQNGGLLLKRVGLAAVLGLMLAGCGAIDADIAADVDTAKEILPLVEPHVKEYWGTGAFHLGSVIMKLDEEQRGEVKLKFADESSAETPNVIEVIVNTAEHKIVGIEELGSGSDVNPGKIELAQWKVDSVEAVELAKKELEYPAEFKPDQLMILSDNKGEFHKGDVWMITMLDKKQNLAHDVVVDAMTGEVVFSASQEPLSAQ